MRKTIPLIIISVLMLCLGTTPLQKALLLDVDALVSYTGKDFSATYTIVQDIPGEGRKKTEAAVFRRDSDNIYSILILQPQISKGQGYLKQGNTLWFYDPDSRVFNSTSSRERFQNSNARNSDFTRSTLAQDYEVTGEKKEKLGKYKCTVLDLKAVTDEVTYPIMKIWISSDNLVRKTEDYSLSGQLLRTTLVPKYAKKEGHYIPRAILMIDHLLGAMVNGKFVNEKTQITIDNVSFDPLPNRVFSKTFLETMSTE